MKSKLRMSDVTQAVTLAAVFFGGGFTAAQAADTVIRNGDIAATISDAGYFSKSTPLGLSWQGNEFVNRGTIQSWYWINATDVPSSPFVARESANDNLLGAKVSGSGRNTAIVESGPGDLTFTQTMSVPSENQLAVVVTLTNNTKHALITYSGASAWIQIRMTPNTAQPKPSTPSPAWEGMQPSAPRALFRVTPLHWETPPGTWDLA